MLDLVMSRIRIFGNEARSHCLPILDKVVSPAFERFDVVWPNTLDPVYLKRPSRASIDRCQQLVDGSKVTAGEYVVAQKCSDIGRVAVQLSNFRISYGGREISWCYA
jgi:hypothetical protein